MGLHTYKGSAVETIIIALERIGRVILASNRCGSRRAQFTSICDRAITLAHTRVSRRVSTENKGERKQGLLTVFTLHFSEITLRDNANLRGDTSEERAWKVQKVQRRTKIAGNRESRMLNQNREIEAEAVSIQLFATAMIDELTSLERWECLRFEEFDFRACVYIAPPPTHRYQNINIAGHRAFKQYDITGRDESSKAFHSCNCEQCVRQKKQLCDCKTLLIWFNMIRAFRSSEELRKNLQLY